MESPYTPPNSKEKSEGLIIAFPKKQLFLVFLCVLLYVGFYITRGIQFSKENSHDNIWTYVSTAFLLLYGINSLVNIYFYLKCFSKYSNLWKFWLGVIAVLLVTPLIFILIAFLVFFSMSLPRSS